MYILKEYSITSHCDRPTFEVTLETNYTGYEYLMKIIDEQNEPFNIDDLKIIFSGEKTICINTKTKEKAIISLQEDSYIKDMQDLDRIWLVVIKYILYSQNRKKEYTALCDHMNDYYDFSIYLAGLIGTDMVIKITDKFLNEYSQFKHII